MASTKWTTYAPDVYRALRGILLVHKPAKVTSTDLSDGLRERIVDQLNQLEPRPISKRILIKGDIDGDKEVVEVPNLADHPLVVGPRYTPWELSMSLMRPLNYKMSGLSIFLLNDANKYYAPSMRKARMESIYHISGKFGYVTDNRWEDGRILDKCTFSHIKSGKMDSVLQRIMSNQYNRLFDSASVPLDSEEAYELAKAWPSRPPTMARWPLIYRLRCIHLKLPHFKLEVTLTNETPNFLAEMVHDMGLLLRSAAYIESIRRVKLGPFSIDDCLLEKDWDLQSIIDQLSKHNNNRNELHQILRNYRSALQIRSQYVADVPQSSKTLQTTVI